MQFENQIKIHIPIDQTFAFVADMRNIPKWNYFVTSVEQTVGTQPDVGATYHQTRETDEQHYKITQFGLNKVVVTEVIKPIKPYFRREMLFEPISNGTQIIDKWELNTRFPGFIENLATGRIQKAVGQNLEKLKILLETGQVTLQNGRVVSL